MEKHQKFLEFNGEVILFLKVEGTYHIALKPLCKALNVDARRSRELAQNDPIIGPEVSIQTLQVSGKGGIQSRNMTCIPEYLVYGWLFSLQSDSPQLIEYKRTCYQLLYNHFHGTIGNRKDLLIERRNIDNQINAIKKEMRQDNEKFKALQELQNQRKTLSTRLNSIDKEIVNQLELFN